MKKIVIEITNDSHKQNKSQVVTNWFVIKNLVFFKVFEYLFKCWWLKSHWICEQFYISNLNFFCCHKINMVFNSVNMFNFQFNHFVKDYLISSYFSKTFTCAHTHTHIIIGLHIIKSWLWIFTYDIHISNEISLFCHIISWHWSWLYIIVN